MATILPFNGPNPLKPPRCMGCPLYDAPGPVFGPPPAKNKILLIGEAPGREEVANWMRWKDDPNLAKQNPNFTGGSGRVLRAWLHHIGVDASACEIRNTVKCRPTAIGLQGTPVDRAPTEEEIRHCLPFFAAELEVIDPNLIVGLGAVALTTLTGHSPITKWRGQVLEGPLRRKEGVADVESNRYKFLSVYHPAFVMRQQQLTPIAIHDLSKLKREAETPEINRIAVDYNTSGVLRGTCASFREAARAAGYVVFDFEAEGIVKTKGRGLDLRTGTITLVGVSCKAYTVDVLNWTGEYQQLFAALAADSSIEKVGQNSEVFDIPYAELRGIHFDGSSFDTLQAFHLTNPEEEKNLEFMASLTSDVLPWKGKQMYKSGFEALKLGNAKDVDTTHRQYLDAKRELKELGMLDLYYNGVMPVQPVLRKMCERGVKRNEEMNWKWRRGAEQLSKNLETKIKDVVGHGINLDSPQQLAVLLYDQLGLPVQYKLDRNRKKVRTVDKGALAKLELLTTNPIFGLISKRRKVEKLDSTYLNLEADDNGFIHPHFGSAKGALDDSESGSAARNGRLISWNPTFHNQPVEVREQYIPDSPEHIFIEADWKQIEWAAAMVLSGEPYGLELLASGADNHAVTAAECFGLSLDEVVARDEKYSGGPGSPRFESKFIVYGLGYGRGAADIALQLRKDIAWVNGFIARFRAKLPVYWEWRTSLERHVAKESFLRNPFGRRRYWYTRQVTEMYNFPPSSTAADMMIRILPLFERQLPRDASTRVTVHDSVLTCSAKDCVREAVTCMRDVMQASWPQIIEASDRPDVVKKFFKNGWYCPVDIHLGNNWKECKKGNKQLEKELL